MNTNEPTLESKPNECPTGYAASENFLPGCVLNEYEDTDKITDGVRITSEKIIRLMKQRPGISAIHISDIIGIAQRAIEMRISKMQKQGRIKHVGPAKHVVQSTALPLTPLAIFVSGVFRKGGHWEVVIDDA